MTRLPGSAFGSVAPAGPTAPIAGTRWVASWISEYLPRGVAHRVHDARPPTWRYRTGVCGTMTMDIDASWAPAVKAWCPECLAWRPPSRTNDGD